MGCEPPARSDPTLPAVHGRSESGHVDSANLRGHRIIPGHPGFWSYHELPFVLEGVGQGAGSIRTVVVL